MSKVLLFKEKKTGKWKYCLGEPIHGDDKKKFPGYEYHGSYKNKDLARTCALKFQRSWK